MGSPRWADDLRRWYDRLWLMPEAPDRHARRWPAGRAQRPPPRWLLAIAPYVLVAAAVGVLLLAIATR
jgi:hypothetical protein